MVSEVELRKFPKIDMFPDECLCPLIWVIIWWIFLLQQADIVVHVCVASFIPAFTDINLYGISTVIFHVLSFYHIHVEMRP